MFRFGCFVLLLCTPLTHHISSCFKSVLLSAFHRRYSSSLSECDCCFATAIAFPFSKHLPDARKFGDCYSLSTDPYSGVLSLYSTAICVLKIMKKKHLYTHLKWDKRNKWNNFTCFQQKYNCKFMHNQKAETSSNEWRINTKKRMALSIEYTYIHNSVHSPHFHATHCHECLPYLYMSFISYRWA